MSESVQNAASYEKLAMHIRAAYPVIFMLTAEESRAEKEIVGLSKSLGRKLTFWSHTDGFMSLGPNDSIVGSKDEKIEDYIDALSFIRTDPPSNSGKIYIMRDLHPGFTSPKVLRLIRDISREFKQNRKTMIMLSPINAVLPQIERDVTTLEFSLPKRADLLKVWNSLYETNKKAIGVVAEDEVELIVQAASGLTTVEAENSIAMSLIERQKMVQAKVSPLPSLSRLVMREKAEAVKKSGVLEYFDATETMADVGGLDALKGWINIRKNALTLQAQEFGLPTPRGILLVGLPGCGKSLSAKASAAIMGVPLIRFDIGRVFAGLVGKSEENMRLGLQTIDAIGNCVVWLDEMEKAFAGMGGSGSTDSGVSQRVFGSFITWMQEKTSPSFVMATVNRIDGLPPELLRKGRFDEIFFVNLPTDAERKEVLTLHVNKDRRKPEFRNGPWKHGMDDVFSEKDKTMRVFEECVDASKGFSGSEIEEAVVSGLHTAFHRKTNQKADYILSALINTNPLSKSAKTQLDAMKSWAEKNARAATSAAVAEGEGKRKLEM